MFQKAFLALVASLVTIAAAYAQAPASLAASLNVQVFPKAGQDAAQQSKDEAECYDWAVTNSGVDPFHLQKKEAGRLSRRNRPASRLLRQDRAPGPREPCVALWPVP